ncbi:tetratricopeptide repeat protein [Hyalangium gracile]|uniref:tetratricopeptide repeat protein n=1 Tax=Hyalangium gracile TaxID=394092 RepID=UPI001CCD2149|nr:tetratricopeptide repeat protein [Hyalangium gracile]
MKTDVYRDAMARLEQGDVTEARRLLEEAWRESPDSVEVMHGLALALDMAGERTRARELLERAHARAPTEPDPACDLAMLFLEHEQDTRAEWVLAPALEAHPWHPRLNLFMAMALAKKDTERARGYASNVLQDTDPELRQQAEALLRVLDANTDRSR